MSLLEKIHHGKRQAPPRLLIYGLEGVGKSQLGSRAPKPIFVQTEDGVDQIDCHSFPLAKSFDDVMACLTALCSEDHAYETVVIDTADWLERLIFDVVCRQYGVKSIEKADGGYGRGYVQALTNWHEVTDALQYLREQKDMIVILLAHAKVEKFQDPESATYDRYSPRLNKHASALLTEWSDAVLFATRKIITRTEDAGFGRDRTIAAALGKDGGERILRCIGGPSCIAKNRYGLPAELPLDWPALMAGIAQSETNNQPLQTQEN